jgi:hypothetical protein
MLNDAWNNPAGGLRYHLRAWKHGREWKAYRKGLQDWLSSWQPGRSTLALVGPSAGHCLPFEALTGFERLVVFEIDPIARFMLKRRIRRSLPKVSVKWITDDMWIGPVRTDGRIPEGLIEPNAAILFCNFIGQVPVMLDPGEYPDFQRQWTDSLFPQLEHTPWASFHDRVSGETAPYEKLERHQRRLDNAEVTALYEADPSRELIELNDHCSQELLPLGYDYRYLHWPLTDTKHHLIECALGGPCEKLPERSR